MEVFLLKVGFALYVVYFLWCLGLRVTGSGAGCTRISCYPLFAAVLFHGVSLGLRWVRLGHGPYIGLYEGLASGLWVSALFYMLVILKNPAFRKTGAVGGGVIVLWFTWLLSMGGEDTRFPLTYDTIWFVVHVVSGKLSYAALFPAFVISFNYLLERVFAGKEAGLVSSRGLEREIYPYMLFVFITATAMMVSGGIWAQSAWGREWSWDSLELGALAIWLIYGLYIHLRITYNALFQRVWYVYMIAAYMLTFYNLFGVPFLSNVIHSGMI